MRRSTILAALLLTGCGRVDTSWRQEDGYRWRALDIPSRGRPGFQPIASERSGVVHANIVTDDSALYNRHLLIGAGVATGDVDGDGRVDLFVASVQRPAVLYRNLGDFRFEDITRSAGLQTQGLASTSAAFADVNGDANLDLLVGTLGGPLRLWYGDGAGRFVAAAAPLADGFAVTTMTLADVDGDGDLDLYAGTYKKRNGLDTYTPQQRAFDQVVKSVGGEYVVLEEWKREYRLVNHPELGGMIRSQRAEADLFFVNDGRGNFTRVPVRGDRFRDEDGRPLSEEPDYFTLASRFYDVNDDGAPDLYVCNDFEDPDQFWINDGRGAFRLVHRFAVRETSNTCMSVDFGDVNRDGHVDFFTADMMSPKLADRHRQFPTHTPMPKQPGVGAERQQWMRNMLQLSRGDGTWASVGEFAGVSATDWTWGSTFLDVDLDGYEDLLAFNGHRWDVRDADTFERLRNSFPRVPWNQEQKEFPASVTRSVAFRNNGDLTFTDRSRDWGIGRDAAISQGVSLADLDGDGDLDVIASRLNAPTALFRNQSVAPRVAVRLVGDSLNRFGVGARVTVRAAGVTQSREMTAGGYYLSGSEPLLSFATGDDSVFSVDVRWRNGRTTTISNARPNRLYEVSAARSEFGVRVAARPAPALFEDASALLRGHVHRDSAYDDFRRQSLLPHRFSQLGPGVTWADVDDDGRADLVVGDGRGGSVSVLRNEGANRPFTARSIARGLPGDVTMVLPSPTRAGALLVAQSNYEAASISEALSIPRVVSVHGGRTTPVFPGDTASVGPMAMADVNGDGQLDLFVGARVVPGAWPLPAASRLYLGAADGTWTSDTTNARVLAKLGLVSSAIFADVTGDARPDLVVTAEWGPVRVLQNEGGRFRDVTRDVGLAGISSRWNGLNAGDFNGDGRTDLVVTSWGRNVSWQASPERPHILVAGNFGSEGVGLVFARRDSATGREMPLESFARVGIAVPEARKRIASFGEYARTDVEALLGARARSAIRVGATTYDHLLFINRGERFDAIPLPPLAQLAPAFAPVVADFDGDGREDLYLAQNFSATEVEAPRLAAGAGLILLGAGDGSFTPLDVSRSGIRVLGDQRGAAISDVDGDGRVDLAVSQNGAATTLWRNRQGAPGLRVRIQGTPGNRFGIGTQLRLVSQTTRGPVRELRAGAGYWSVDDPLSVLGGSRSATALWVRWPNGTEQTVPLTQGQLTLTVRHP